LFFCAGISNHKKMNSVLSVRQAYEQARNIYDDVKNFQKQEYHSEPFLQVMQWLQECVVMRDFTAVKAVESKFTLQCREHQIVFESYVEENICKVTTIRYQNEQSERVNGHVSVH